MPLFFLCPLKDAGGIQRDQWREMGQPNKLAALLKKQISTTRS